MSLSVKISIFLLLLTLPTLTSTFSQGKKETFDVHKPNLLGLFCYQCDSVSSEPTPICDSTYFASANTLTKTRMLIQCPSDCLYCLKKMSRMEAEVWRTERACGTAFDSIGQRVRSGCMIEKNLSVCVCGSNLCNGAVKGQVSREIWGLLGALNYLCKKFG